MLPSSPIALIFFSRNAENEGLAKSWLGKARTRSNAAIAKALIDKAQSNVQKAGLDVLHFDERRQRGEQFGERLAHAFADVFAMGYRAAIAVGNDSPELGATDWAALKRALENGHNILGPTLRGGAYLIGMQAEGFLAADFAALPWQTVSLYAALSSQLCARETVYELPILRDLNTLQDLKAYIKARPGNLAHQLASLLHLPSSKSSYYPQKIQDIHLQGQQHRGPPVLQ